MCEGPTLEKDVYPKLLPTTSPSSRNVHPPPLRDDEQLGATRPHPRVGTLRGELRKHARCTTRDHLHGITSHRLRNSAHASLNDKIVAPGEGQKVERCHLRSLLSVESFPRRQ